MNQPPERPIAAARLVVMIAPRLWACSHCGQEHRMDHDLDDLTNLECRQCDRVSLGRLVMQETP